MRRLSSEADLFNPDYILVKPSRIEGNGIFVAKPCKAGEILMIITGETIDGEECLRRENEEGNVYIFYNGDDRYIDAAMTDKIRFINHSCSANASVSARDDASLYLVALCDLSAGEEITIDYDYEEIYEVCFLRNPACKKADCPSRQKLTDLLSLRE
jgi:SET domain-containing protein